MSDVVVSEFVSFDGVMEDPGGSEEFEHGGWAFQFDRGPEGDEFKLDEVLLALVLVLVASAVLVVVFAPLSPPMYHKEQ